LRLHHLCICVCLGLSALAHLPKHVCTQLLQLKHHVRAQLLLLLADAGELCCHRSKVSAYIQGLVQVRLHGLKAPVK
jgi:hypothetical protein